MAKSKHSDSKSKKVSFGRSITWTKILGVAFLILIEGYVLLLIARIAQSIYVLLPLVFPCVLILVYVFIQMYKSAKSVPRHESAVLFKELSSENKASFAVLFALIGIISAFMLFTAFSLGADYILPGIIGVIGFVFLFSKAINRDWEFNLV